MTRLCVGVMTCHGYDYKLDDLTQDWLRGKRCLNQDLRVRTIRQTWKTRIPNGVDFKFFYGQSKDREPLSDEVFLDCRDRYVDNPEKMKAMSRWVLGHGFDWLLRTDDDTYLYPNRLLREDWQHDYVGANKGSFHPGGCLFLSRRAMELIVRSRPTSYADDLWIGQVMAENRIPMHSIASIHNEFGTGYNVIPASLPIHRLASLHSCSPDAMKYLDEHTED